MEEGVQEDRKERRNMKVERAEKSEEIGRDDERRMMRQCQEVNVDNVLCTSPVFWGSIIVFAVLTAVLYIG